MAQVHWLDDERFVNDGMLEDMEKKVRILFDCLRTIESGLLLLRFLNSNANTMRTIEDIAYWLKRPHLAVERSLYVLADLGLARWSNIVGLTFFGLTADPEKQQLVRDLCDWQDRWYARSALIENVLDGNARQPFARSIRPEVRV